MKKVISVDKSVITLDDGTTLELVFDQDVCLTIEEAQIIYNQSVCTVENLMVGDETSKDK